MKGKRIARWISLMLSAMLVLTLFPMNALAEEVTPPASPTPDTVTYHTVTFLDWDETKIGEDSVADGGSAKAPSDPTREGYEFVGWDKGLSNVTEDLTVNALYKEVEAPLLRVPMTAVGTFYTVTYDANGGTGGMSDSSSPYAEGSNFTVLANGFTPPADKHFTGWNTAANGKGTAYSASTAYAITGNITLYAQWAMSTLTIRFTANAKVVEERTFDVTAAKIDQYEHTSDLDLLNKLQSDYGPLAGKSGSFSGDDLASHTTIRMTQTGTYSYFVGVSLNNSLRPSITINYRDESGVDLIRPETDNGKIGHSYTAYAEDIDGYVPDAESKSIVVKFSNTITFVYSRAKYTITYDANGGSGTTKDPSSPYLSGTSVTVLANNFTPPANKHFVRWDTRSNGHGDSYDPGDTLNLNSNTTLYAVWALNPLYTVRYYANYHNISISDQYFEGTSVTVRNNFYPAPFNTHFKGWNTAANGTGTSYAAGGSFTITGDVSLYAQWASNQYKVYYNANGGTGTMTDSASYNDGSSFTVKSNTFTSLHNHFTGWNSAANGSGTSYTAGSSYSSADDDVTLYAQWAPDPQFSVSYDANGGTGEMTDTHSPYYTGTSFTVLGNGFTAPEHKHFTGWNSALDGSGTSYAVGSSYPVSVDVTLFAQWQYDTHTVTYDANGGSGSTVDPLSPYTYGTAYVVLNNQFTRENFVFDHWNTAGDDSGTTVAVGSTETLLANTTYYAIWESDATGPAGVPDGIADKFEYAVSYQANGGDAASIPSDSNIYPEGYSVSLIFTPTPTRTGYDFLGWSETSTAETPDYSSAGMTALTMGAADRTLHAVWKLHEYSITYTLNGGVNDGANPATYTFETETFTLAEPTKAGYDFTGWSPAETTITKNTTGDKAFTATWSTAIVYKITYDAAGGVLNSANPATYTVESDAIDLLPPTRLGYNFTGWSPANSIPAHSTEDKHFVATWSTAIVYNITYVLNDGTHNGANPSSYTVESPTITLQPATRTGYNFIGWYVGNTKYTTIPTNSTGDKTFTAKWSTPIQYNIRYVMNGGANNPWNPSSYKVNDAITLRNPLGRIGYDFTGWTPDGGVILKGSTGEKSFTAGWSPKTYNLTYKLNGGTNNSANPATYTIETANIHLADPSRPGYTFLGWFWGIFPVSDIPTGTVGNWTLTAVWSPFPITYDITYELNGGTNAGSNPKHYWVTSSTITLAAPTREGYTFDGWSPDDGEIPASSTGDRTFTASWTPITYEIEYALNGGTVSGNPDTYTIETPTFTLNNPTRDFYTFGGWSPKDTTIEKGSTGDLKFTASWTPIGYTIKYNLGGGDNADSNPDTYTVETPTFELAAPSRDYYTFNGWTPTDTTIEQGSHENLEFTASWKPIVYDIEYDLAGGVNAGTNPTSYTVETPTFTLADPARDYYTFDGWTPTDTVAQGSHVKLKFTANWTPVEYTIKYNLGGGDNASENPATYNYETPTFTLADPARDYYTFAGWDAEDITIEQHSSGNLEFTASWTPIVYDIEYDLANGVNAGTNPTSYTVETPEFTIADPTRTGYNFLGWTPADTTIEQGSHGDLKFTAKWSDPIVYNIAYDLGGGINALANPATYTVETDTITLAPPTRAGYNFVAWTPEGTITKGSTGNLSFTATWSDPIVYPITYVMNGGVNSGLNPATYTVVTPAIALAAPTRAGYTFTGWTPAGGIPLGSTGARTFTATWSAPIEYDITYILNGGINAAANPATYDVTSGLITLANPTRTGYDFLGWTPDGVIPTGSTGDLTFTTRWSEPHVHTVTYFVSGGTQAGLDGTTPFAVYENIAYGAPVPIPDDPAQAEYTFGGWSSEIPATMPDDDVVLYGTLTKLPVLQEIITNEKTPLAAPSWSLLNLIFTVLSVLGLGSIINMLIKKRNETATKKNTLFSLSTLVPAAGAVVVFLLTQKLSGSMVFADQWSLLMGGILLLQGVLVALGFKKA